MSATDPIRTFTDAELDRAIGRAYREAARCWQEYRANDAATIESLLHRSANEAQKHWQYLANERDRRAAVA